LYCIATADHTLIELYHGAFEEFNIKDSEVDIILLDSFPNAERYFIDMAEEIRKRYPGINVVCI
jgi:hypothetical protein